MTIRIASSVLPTASLWLMKWAKPGSAAICVFTVISPDAKSSGNERPAGNRLAVLGVGLEARLLHRGGAGLVEPRVARAALDLHAARQAGLVYIDTQHHPAGLAGADRQARVLGHRRIAEVLHRRGRNDLGRRRRRGRRGAATGAGSAAAAAAAAQSRAEAPARRTAPARATAPRRSPPAAGACGIGWGTRRRRRRWQRHRLRRLGRDQVDEHRRHVGDPSRTSRICSRRPEAGRMRRQDRADQEMALHRRQRRRGVRRAAAAAAARSPRVPTPRSGTKPQRVAQDGGAGCRTWFLREAGHCIIE